MIEKTPFEDEKKTRATIRAKSHEIQEYLVKGEKGLEGAKIGDFPLRENEPPPEEDLKDPSYSEEEELAAANGDVAETHPLLACQQFDGRDPKRDPRIPTATDLINYADAHPELILSPQLRLQLENVKRMKLSSAPALKPAGM